MALGSATMSPHTVPGAAVPLSLCCHLSSSPGHWIHILAQASGCCPSCSRGAAASVSGSNQEIVKASFSAQKLHFLEYKVLFSKYFPSDDCSLHLGQALAWAAQGGGSGGPWSVWCEPGTPSPQGWLLGPLCHQRCGHCWWH